MDFSNLIHKTVYDFCDDEAILKRIVKIPKEEYIKKMKESPYHNCFDMFKLAQLAKIPGLGEAADKQFFFFRM